MSAGKVGMDSPDDYPNRPAIAIPIQNLHPVRPPIGEHQKVAGIRVAPDHMLGQHRQSVKRTAHITWHCTEIDLDRRRKTQHPAGSSAARTVRSVTSSTPLVMRSRRPPLKTNSTPASIAPASSLTRAKLAACPFAVGRGPTPSPRP